jgi:hypothetical protein
VTRAPGLLRLERRGGLPPRDDEEVRVGADGSFTARRTIGGPRIGSFQGKLAKGVVGRLTAAVDALATAEDATIVTPRHGATEVLEAGGRTIRLGSNETPPKPWRALVNRVRKLLEDEVVDSPHAAVILAATAGDARLDHAGDARLEINLGSVAVRVIHLDDEGLVLGRWAGRLVEQVSKGKELVDRPDWVTAGPGWTTPLPFDHAMALKPGESFQVWVGLQIREADGPRPGQLYVPVLTDA